MHYVNIENIKFLLHEVFNIKQLQAIDRFSSFDRELVDMTIDASKQI